MDKNPIESLMQELKRGTLVLGVLSQLKEPLYGYSLVSSLSEKGMEIDKNTLYPLLRRLESQELLISEWNVEESRPRRYYKLSDKGHSVLKELAVEWENLNDTIKKLLED
ncbi:MAG: PadR family transcriptional regulator [Eubacteriales bacterium]